MRDIITKLEELNTEKAKLNEGLGDMAHEAEKDHEVQMARSDCYKSAKYAVSIHKMLKDVSEMEGIDGWVASKLTKAADYLGSVKHYMEGEMMSDVELAVVPVAGDMTDAMTMPQESIEEVHEAEERTYIVVHAKHGKEEIKASSSYAAAKKYAEMKKLKSTAGVDAHLADEKKTATESIEEGMHNNMPCSLKCKYCGDMLGQPTTDCKYDSMNHMQDNWVMVDLDGDGDKDIAIAKEEVQVTEDREVMVRATNIDYDGPALDKLPTDVNVKVMVNPGDSEDEIFDAVADELEDRYGVKVSGFDMKMMEDMSDDEIDDFHKELDDVVHKHLGHSSDEEEEMNEEDVIGDIIGKLNKMGVKTPGVMPKSKPNTSTNQNTGATRGAGDDAEYMRQAAMANMPAQQKQKMANKMVTQSKFSEWGKK